jgi:hypothetical protein
MYQFLSVILIVFGILQIILFFKMWGMTNDVKTIKKLTSEANNSNWTAAKLETLVGDYDKAYNIYFKCFISDVYELYNSAYSDYPSQYAKLVETYKKRLDTLKGEYSIDFEKYDSDKKIRTMIFRG